MVAPPHQDAGHGCGRSGDIHQKRHVAGDDRGILFRQGHFQGAHDHQGPAFFILGNDPVIEASAELADDPVKLRFEVIFAFLAIFELHL